jgi:RHS repeat-associated protein
MNPSGTEITSSALNNRYIYTGREWDNGLNLCYFRARWYDGTIGRFVARDPLGFVDGHLLYAAYFHTKHTDPLGKDRYITREFWEPRSDQEGVFRIVPRPYHMSIAVDDWVCKKGFGWVKVGVLQYDFSVELDYGLGIVPGVFAYPGWVTRSDGSDGFFDIDDPRIAKSNPCQDITLSAELNKDLSNAPWYSLINFWTCQDYARHYFVFGGLFSQLSDQQCDALCPRTARPVPSCLIAQ